MSQATRLYAARKGLEAILRLARERNDAPLVALAELALVASAESESATARRAADAERKRTARGLDADGVRTSSGRRADSEGGEGGGVSPDRSTTSQDHERASVEEISPEPAQLSISGGSRGGPADIAAPSARRPQRGARLPDDWKPRPATIRALADELGVDPRPAIVEFRDYWRGVAGAKGLKLDWEATFRNRVRELARLGRLPELPPETPPPAPAANGEKARSVLDVLYGTSQALPKIPTTEKAT